MDNKNFINKEIDKIVKNEDLKYPLNLAMACAWILGNFKGINLKVINVSERSSLSDYFILGSSNNPVQSRAMAEEIQVQMKRHGHYSKSVEGLETGEWILVDLGDVMVHIFQENTREIFDLDSLWGEAPIINIPQEYYYSSQDENRPKSEGMDFF